MSTMNTEDVDIFRWAGMQSKSWAEVVANDGQPPKPNHMFTAKEKVLMRIFELKRAKAMREGKPSTEVTPPPPPKPEDFENITYDSFIKL